MSREKTPEQREKWAAYMRSYRAKNTPKPNQSTIPTDRQIQILRMYADPTSGGSQAKVAEALGISTSAVHNQINALLKRLGVKSPAQAVYRLMVEPYQEDQ